MIATASFLVFLGFFIFYSTSGKIKGNGGFMHRKISANKPIAKVFSLLLFLAALGILIAAQGLAAGIFYFFIMLMVLGSFVIVLSPLEVFSIKAVIPFFIVFLMVEYFLKF